jgi:hypothetical protein
MTKFIDKHKQAQEYERRIDRNDTNRTDAVDTPNEVLIENMFRNYDPSDTSAEAKKSNKHAPVPTPAPEPEEQKDNRFNPSPFKKTPL